MRALVKAKPERGIWLEQIQTPEIGHNDVLIKVRRTAYPEPLAPTTEWNRASSRRRTIS